MISRFHLALPLYLAGAWAAFAHVGSPDVFFEGMAGPYPLIVTVRPPLVVPGTAWVEIRCTAGDIRQVRMAALPLTGEGARRSPVPDVAERWKDDPQFFTGSLWLTIPGVWQIRIQADGARGTGEMALPVPALLQRTLRMQKTLGAFLFALMLLLAVGAVSLVGASVREGILKPGVAPTRTHLLRARALMIFASVGVAALLYLGNRWWVADARSYEQHVYRARQLTVALEGGNLLALRIQNSDAPSMTEDLIPDHNHLLHLFLVRLPGMDRFWHLHPERTGSETFSQQLPDMPRGHYQLFADIVHQSGLGETLTGEIDIAGISGTTLSGDDSQGQAPPLSQPLRDAAALLPSGGRMVWEREPSPLKAGRAAAFRFRVEDENGKPSEDLELYMGMTGHAVFVRTDRSVFAHVHPAGSIPMAALALANPHAAHSALHTATLPSVVSFPFGLPQPGDYRMFIQVKRSGKVETGIFDAHVEP